MKLINFLFDRDCEIILMAGGVWYLNELETMLKIILALGSIGYLIWKWNYEYKKMKNENK